MAQVDLDRPAYEDAMLSDADLERYARQVIIPHIGEDGQERLLGARVLVVGAGGLGAPVILYLAAAGIGHITIIDDDMVSHTDLNRQIIYRDKDVGNAKAKLAAQAANTINPNIQVSHLVARLTKGNAKSLVAVHDVIVDCSDNASTRYLLGDCAHHQGRTLVFGGAVRMEGQLAVFQSSVAGHVGTACYRCVFPSMPDAKQAPGCSEAGILGAVTGIVGSLQALETVKLCMGQDSSLTGSLLLIEAGQTEFMKITTAPRKGCSCCGTDQETG